MTNRTLAILSVALALAGAPRAAIAQIAYQPPVEATLKKDVRAGKLDAFVLPPGQYYPGTPHDYVVYTPAGYDGTRPLPVMVFLDGIQAFLEPRWQVNVILDNLIAARQIPPLVAVFVDPGVNPARSDQVQNRYERHFEYDSITDRYSRFLLEELLPTVSKTYPLSQSPDDRALVGSSTGAVGAFSATWNRPDQFHRVMSFVGTYISMKGAHTLANLVRKTEPRPLRIFMQAGKRDHLTDLQPFGTRYAGSWPTANQTMYEALQFAGYDVNFQFGEAGHEASHGRAVMPDALRWLWRDYPRPIKVTAPAYYGMPGAEDRGHVFSVIDGEHRWEQIGSQYGRISSIVADRTGNVFFDDDQGRIFRLSAKGGRIALFAEGEGQGSPMAMGADGRLYVARKSTKTLVSYGADRGWRDVATNFEARALAATKDGSLYAINAAGAILLVKPDGTVSTAYSGQGLVAASSIALSPDQAFVIVGDAKSRFAWSLRIAEDGRLVDGEPYYRLEMPETSLYSESRSVTVNTLGQPFFASPLGIQGFEAAGRQGPILNAPVNGATSAVAFVGGRGDWLYAAVEGKLYRRPVKVKAVTADTLSKPPAPPL